MFKYLVLKKAQSRYSTSIARGVKKKGEKHSQQHSATTKEKQAATNPDEKAKVPDLGQLRRTNCWRLWLERGLSVEDIAFCLRMQPDTVINNIFSCARTIEKVDWCRLSKLVKMTPDIAESILTGRAMAKQDATNISVSDIMKFCPRNVTALHIGLVHAMLGRGLSSSEILQKSKAEVMDPSNVTTNSRVNNESVSLIATDSCDRQEDNSASEGSLNVAAEDNCSAEPEAAEPLSTDPGLKTEEAFEYIDDCGTRKKAVTKFGLLQWLEKVDGATLSNIVQAFEECDEMYLMRLLIDMVDNSTIIRHQGIFRSQSKNCTGRKAEDSHLEDK